MRYAGIWLGLFAATALFNVLPNPLSVLTVTCPAIVYVVPVAVCTHFGHWRKGLGLIAGAALAALAGGGLLLLGVWREGFTQLTLNQLQGVIALSAVNAAVIAALGIPIGMGTVRGWTYSRVVAATAAALCAVVGTYLALCWDAFNRVIDAMIAVMIEQVNLQAAERGAEITERLVDGVRWFGENKFAFAIGIEFALCLVVACVLVSITAIALRRKFADPGPIGSFRDMHPPDWLVWLAILTALLWFAEREYGGAHLRFASWNAAVGLGAIYFLNGCAIFLYGVQVLAPNALLVALLVLLITMTGQLRILAIVGFFDTWVNFRQRMDRLAEAIRNAQSGNGST